MTKTNCLSRLQLGASFSEQLFGDVQQLSTEDYRFQKGVAVVVEVADVFATNVDGQAH